jgi:hypothetical protein
MPGNRASRTGHTTGARAGKTKLGNNDYPSMLERFKCTKEKVEEMLEKRNSVSGEEYRY